MKKWSCFVLFWASILSLAPAQTAGRSDPVAVYVGIDEENPQRTARIDEIVSRYMRYYRYINVGLLNRAEITVVRSYGEDRLDRREIFASVSKPITATIVLQLYESGVIADLDAPISVYDEKYERAMPDRFSNSPLTLYHLLSHRSGIPHQSAFRRNGTFLLDFEPGSQMQYSTKAYGLIGEVLERVTGKKYGTLVRDMIGEPVGGDSFRADDLFFETPAGRVWATQTDMMRFAQGIVKEVYISESTLRTIVLQPKGSDRQGIMGAGWYLADLGTDEVAVYHAGSEGKPRAFLAIEPFTGNAVGVTARAIRSDHPGDLGSLAIELMNLLGR